MRLTLEVISANGDVLGSNRSKTIGPEGAQIGRSKESDWVINDPYISRIHARVRFVNGTYYVEGTGRNPLALNDPSNVVPNNQPQLLRNGDRFFLDQYEIRVTMDTSSERKPPPMDPFAQEPDSPTVRVPPVVPVVPPQPAWHPAEANPHDIRIQNADDVAALDPLALLDSGRSASPPPVRPINLDQGPVIENQFSPPQPMGRPLHASDPTPLPINAPTQKIPDEYRPGLTHLGPATPQVEPTTRKLPPTPGAGSSQPGGTGRGGKGIPNSWLNPTGFPQADPAAPLQPLASQTTPLHVGPPPAERPPPRFSPPERPEPRPQERPERPEPRVNPFERTEARPGGAERPADRPERPEPRFTPPERPEPRVNPFERPEPRVAPTVNKTINRALQVNSAHAPPADPVPVRETRSASLEQLLASAGLPASQMSPELAQELGEVLRVVVQGLMEVLQSRAEIKSQLRMNMTLMKPAENNPLKFSPNVEAALHTLLVERNRGYLPTVRAFQEALIDIRHHQIAVLQGIRSAFQAMLEQFNPTRLEQEFERHGGKRGLLNVGAKGRFRDAYIEEFERLTRDPDESFKRLFGEYFAQAYEDQMEYLKAAARNDAR
jgi:type VI secretion system FHA domain protein